MNNNSSQSHPTNLSDPLKETTEAERVLEELDLLNQQDTTVQQEAFFLHISRLRHLRALLDKHALDIKERQNKIKFLHELMQKLNNLVDDEGKIDFTADPTLTEDLKIAKELGVNISTDQTKLSRYQTDRLMDNLRYSISDWETSNNIDLRKASNIYSESEQSIMIVRNTITSIDRPIRAMIAGIKGA
jgi:hypothetical protein